MVTGAGIATEPSAPWGLWKRVNHVGFVTRADTGFGGEGRDSEAMAGARPLPTRGGHCCSVYYVGLWPPWFCFPFSMPPAPGLHFWAVNSVWCCPGSARVSVLGSPSRAVVPRRVQATYGSSGVCRSLFLPRTVVFPCLPLASFYFKLL